MSELNEAQLTQLYEDWTALGAKREQERIIELLESVYDYPRGWDYDNPIASVIALIKGENK
jgi:predicted Zn-dependent protease